MKKVVSIFLAALLVFTMAPVVFANVNVTLDGAEIEFDVPAQLINERTMVPLRAIFTALNAEIDWDDYTQTVTSERDGIVVVMQIGNPVITVGCCYVELDVPPMLVDGRTLVPVRAVAESFGVNVEWNPYTYTVVLTTGYAYTPGSGYTPGYTYTPASNVYGGLVGEWLTYFLGVNDDWGVTFNADGTGRWFWSIDAEDMSFLWTMSAGNYVLIDLESIGHDFGLGWELASRYSFSINGNRLILESMDVPGFPTEYVRR